MQSTRQRLAQRCLDELSLRKEMLSLFPRRNDYGPLAADELISELKVFGVVTVLQFRKLMKRHRRALITIDRSPMSVNAIRYASESFGQEFVKDAISRQYWFAFPALIRIAMELEFGPVAAVYEE